MRNRRNTNRENENRRRDENWRPDEENESRRFRRESFDEDQRYFGGGGQNYGQGYDSDDPAYHPFTRRSGTMRQRDRYGSDRPRYTQDLAYGDYDKAGYDRQDSPYYNTRSNFYDPATGTRFNYGPSRLRDYPASEEGFDLRENDRGWWDKTADEVSSWFGDEDAARRRRMDERNESHRGRGPKGYTRSDDRITEDINDRLTDYHYLDASDIEVSVSGGDVTLSGKADSRYDKRLAEDLAHDVLGVKNVENRIRIESRDTTSNEPTMKHQTKSA